MLQGGEIHDKLYSSHDKLYANACRKIGSYWGAAFVMDLSFTIMMDRSFVLNEQPELPGAVPSWVLGELSRNSLQIITAHNTKSCPEAT